MYTYKRKSRLKMVAHRLIGTISFVLFFIFVIIELFLSLLQVWSAANWLTGGDFNEDYITNFVGNWHSTIIECFETEERELVKNNPNKI